MTVQASASSLERELEYRKKLTSITNQINAAESIPHILMTLKDRILELLDAERLTIYAVDTKNQELYSMTKVGDMPKEIPHYIVIDWEATANNLRADYTTIEWGDQTYYVR